MTEKLKKQIVVCAAIRHKRSGLILCGSRHFDMIMARCIEAYKEEKHEFDTWVDADQGFIDQFGDF